MSKKNYFMRRFFNSFKAVGRLHHVIVTAKSITIWIIIILIYLITILFFAALYYINKENFDMNSPRTIFNFIYFSVTVQTSIGFGDITPQNLSKLIYCIHAVIGFFENALLIGILISRTIDRKHNVISGDYICYIPPISPKNKKDRLILWFMNLDNSAIYDVRYKLGLTKYFMEKGKPAFKRYYLNTIDNGFSYLSKMTGFLIGTTQDFEEITSSVDSERKGKHNFSLKNNLNDFNSINDITVSVDVTYKSVDTNNEFFIRKTYTLDKIICGQYAGLIENNDRVAFRNWKNRNYANFSKFSIVNADTKCKDHYECKKRECEFWEFCPLKKIGSKTWKKLLVSKSI